MYPPLAPTFQPGPLTLHWYGLIVVITSAVLLILRHRNWAGREQDAKATESTNAPASADAPDGGVSIQGVSAEG